MKINLNQLIYSIILIVIGIFLRDVYAWIKKHLFKIQPKISVNHICKWRSAYNTNPRNYKFENNIILQNIDTEPLYDVQLYVMDADEKSLKISQELVSPAEKINYEEEVVVEYGDAGNFTDEAKKLLPSSVKNPLIIVEYKNKKGNKFSIKKQF